jgi:hypothetical protein
MPPEIPSTLLNYGGFELPHAIVNKAPWPVPVKQVDERTELLQRIDTFEVVEGEGEGFTPNKTMPPVFKCV